MTAARITDQSRLSHSAPHDIVGLVRLSAPSAVPINAPIGWAQFEKFHRAWSIYEASFPPDERRAFAEQLKIILQPDYQFLYHKSPDGQITGIIATWKLGQGEFYFIEHLAVDELMRGKGIGSEIVQSFIKDKAKVVLEVEPAHFSPEAEKRIGFYTNLGFHPNDYPYYQPPYAPGKKPLNMKILSYPNPLKKEELDRFKELVYARVYNVEPNSNFGAEPREVGL